MVGVATLALTSGLRVPITASLPHGVYRMVEGAPTRGALGLWCLPPDVARWAFARGYLTSGRCPGGTAPVGKVVLAAAGDTVCLRPSGIVVNGRAVPNSRPLPRDASGRSLTPVRSGLYVLRPGQVWLWSPFATRSFDSRYFGPTPAGGLVSQLRPVLTAIDWPPWVAGSWVRSGDETAPREAGRSCAAPDVPHASRGVDGERLAGYGRTSTFRRASGVSSRATHHGR